ncbi:MAG: hypothetical protein PHX74_05640 [Candidatus Sumerlaeales bacterium]|nr:hypothetical protein [Candidatus Sumerlaeales bacterium]
MKDSGEIDATWDDLASYINKEFRADETEYRTESAYRKQYQAAKMYYDEVFAKQIGGDSYLESMREERQELYKVKTQVRDERNELNRKLRAAARLDDTFEELGRSISDLGKDRYPIVTKCKHHGETDVLCGLADIHFGIEFASHTGTYNSDIAKLRIMEYAGELVSIGKRHESRDVYVAMLGDLVSGIIHSTISKENRENIIHQITGVSAIISDFIYVLADYFDNVYVNSVGGNHSRLQPKDLAVKDERLDNLIPWHLECEFRHMSDRVHIIPVKDNIDSTAAEFIIREKSYVAVHGDYDPFTDAGMARLISWFGKTPYAIISAHMHTLSYDDSPVIRIRSGSLCGSGDDYTVERRLRGEPSQVACVISKNGVVTMYPVRLS